MLGGSIKDPKVQALIKKLFVNISAILPDDLGIIDLLYTTDGEDLPLCKSVNTKINTVEGWLAEMLEETKVAAVIAFKAKLLKSSIRRIHSNNLSRLKSLILNSVIVDILLNSLNLCTGEHQAASPFGEARGDSSQFTYLCLYV